MFSEILRIKPQLDTATAAQMEQSLSGRFARVAQRFGKGLTSVIKGSVLGISLGLISKLLNPLEALEDKIKKLMGEGTDIRELAEKMGTTPGQLKQVQDVATTLGVTPDQFKDMLIKYSDAIDTAREELANPFEKPSEKSMVVRQFVGDEDKVRSFVNFLTSLQAVGRGPGIPLNLGHGEIRPRTGLETRQAFEKTLFGGAQTGAARRLIEANIPEAAKRINEPGIDALNKAINNVASLADQKRTLDVQNETQDFLNASARMNGKMVEDMANAERIRMDRDTRELESYDDLKKAAIAIDQVKNLFIEANLVVNKGIGYLADIAGFVQKFRTSRLLNLGGLFGKGD